MAAMTRGREGPTGAESGEKCHTLPLVIRIRDSNGEPVADGGKVLSQLLVVDNLISSFEKGGHSFAVGRECPMPLPVDTMETGHFMSDGNRSQHVYMNWKEGAGGVIATPAGLVLVNSEKRVGYTLNGTFVQGQDISVDSHAGMVDVCLRGDDLELTVRFNEQGIGIVRVRLSRSAVGVAPSARCVSDDFFSKVSFLRRG